MQTKNADQALDGAIEIWKKLATLSGYQEKAVTCWQRMLWGGIEPRMWMQLAPTWLHQTINPWSFSLVNFMSQIKGDPITEAEIVSRVAGYGSQLGTIIDALEVLVPMAKERPNLLDDERYALWKLEALAKQIDRIKER